MNESERGSFPDNVHIRFTRADILRVLLGAVDLRCDAVSIQQVAALADKIADWRQALTYSAAGTIPRFSRPATLRRTRPSW